MPVDPYPGTPSPNTLADATKLRAQLDVLFGGGKSIIATEESRTNTAYGTLATPDQVAGVVLPADGVIVVGYRALWKESVAGAARAGIFLGANQLKIHNSDGSTGSAIAQQAATGAGSVTNTYLSLASFEGGLSSLKQSTGAVSDVTTGQVVGHSATGAGAATYEVGSQQIAAVALRSGLVAIFAAAGTYTVSVQFKASSGSVTAKERKLWVFGC